MDQTKEVTNVTEESVGGKADGGYNALPQGYIGVMNVVGERKPT